MTSNHSLAGQYFLNGEALAEAAAYLRNQGPSPVQAAFQRAVAHYKPVHDVIQRLVGTQESNQQGASVIAQQFFQVVGDGTQIEYGLRMFIGPQELEPAGYEYDNRIQDVKRWNDRVNYLPLMAAARQGFVAQAIISAAEVVGSYWTVELTPSGSFKGAELPFIKSQDLPSRIQHWANGALSERLSVPRP